MEEERCWWGLLRSSRTNGRLFAALHTWRTAVLQKKHRYRPPTSDEEELHIAFFEDELPLHLAVLALDMADRSAFGLLGYVFSCFPASALSLDTKRRSAFFYAIRQRWSIENLEWLADKSLPLVLEKDTEGLSIIAHAVLLQCSQELIIRLAVAAALKCITNIDNLMDGRHFQSARRFCRRCLVDIFAGVPKFPYSASRFALGGNSGDSDAVDEVRALWAGFADKWGHDDAPLIQHDLPVVLRAPIESSVEVSIMAKGEPLSYQWFCNDGPIDGATLPLFYLSQSVQPHNAGVYRCEIRNRKGQTLSTAMDVQVVDDRVQPDPTEGFRVDKRQLRSEYDTWRNVKAATGAFMRHSAMGVTVLLPPKFFVCRDAGGRDVSNSLGADIAICNVSSCDENSTTKPPLRLQADDQLVSCVVDILPHTIGNLLRPATICIPHCLATGDRFYRPVVVEIDANTGKYRDVDTLLTSPESSAESTWTGCASVRIPHLGRFAVVARKLPGNLELEAPLERLQLVLVRPRTISAMSLKAQVVQAHVSFWLIRDRPDIAKDWEDRVDSDAFEPGSQWEVDRFPVRARGGQVVCVQVGTVELTVHHWCPPPLWGAENSSQNRSDRGVAALASSIVVDLEKAPDNQASPERSPFCSVSISTSVRKLTRTMNPKNREMLLQPDTIDENTVLLSESNWTTLIPIEHDECAQEATSTPVLRCRTSSHIVLDLEPTATLTDPTNTDAESVNRSASTAEPEATTPYYYVVEMASFSTSFWSRYDKTWWFDKTKTAVIDGMYKVVHHGYSRSVTIVTSAFAGCIRVARCSVDFFGAYSEPLLIEPLGHSDGGQKETPSSAPELSEEPQQLQTTAQRLDELIRAHYQDASVFQNIYGVPPDSLQVSTGLEAMRMDARSANYELSLLLVGLTNLKKRLMLVHVGPEWYIEKLGCVLALEHFVPELDRSPVRFASVISQMHELIQDAFTLVWKLSSDGWLRHLLQGKWLDHDVGGIQRRVVNLLTTEARDLRGAFELCQLLDQRAHTASKMVDLSEMDSSKIPWTSVMVQRYLLLVAGGLSTGSQNQTPADQRTILDALCHSLTLSPPGSTTKRSKEDDMSGDPSRVSQFVSELYKEVETLGFCDAITTLQLDDSLPSHLVRTTPRDGELCASVPTHITFYFDDGTVGLSDSGLFHAVKVVNLSRDWSNVQGRIKFSGTHATLTFVPAVPFEKQCRYRVLVKPQELVTSLGATLPKTEEPLAFHFSTPA